MCGACEHVNFKKREACQRCGYLKYGGPHSEYPTAHEHGIKTEEALAGDWYCKCGAHNYATRSSCYRCHAYKSLDLGAFPGWKSGDWICTRYVYTTNHCYRIGFNYVSKLQTGSKKLFFTQTKIEINPTAERVKIERLNDII